jgi:hypothetical protein
MRFICARIAFSAGIRSFIANSDPPVPFILWIRRAAKRGLTNRLRKMKKGLVTDCDSRTALLSL